MRALLINPEDQSITEITYDGNYKSLYDIIGNGCICFSAFATEFSNDTFYYDDEGLFHNNIGGIIYPGWASPIVGKIVVLGSDDEGDTIAPISYIDEIKVGLRFLSPQELEGYFEQFN